MLPETHFIPYPQLLAHQSELVRKKATIVMHRFHQLSPDQISASSLSEKLRRVLCDKDPSVMCASLCVIEKMCRGGHAMKFKDLVPSLVSILKQITEHRLPADYDYHRMPAPWMQMKIVRILAILGQGDKSASEGMYEILAESLKRADVGINAGYAVMYEIVKAVTLIYPNNTLLDLAAESISRFISSNNHNLKYLGVTGLASIVKDHPKYAAQHQIAVIDCLEDPDETLQRKTLALLFRMTNPVNIEFICDKLLSFLSSTSDEFLRKDLTNQITQIAERYAPTNTWYIKTITKLFSISGDLVQAEVAHNLMTLIAEGSGEDEESDIALRRDAVDTYTALLETSRLPPVLMETMSWVLGEYSYLSETLALEDIISKLCTLARRPKLDRPTRRHLTTAVMKLVSQAGTCPPMAARLIDAYTKSSDVDLQQRCLEFQNLLKNAPQLLPDVFPVDASCEDVEADEKLSCMDSFVAESLAKGAIRYTPPNDVDDDDENETELRAKAKKTAFKMTPYAKPESINKTKLSTNNTGSNGENGMSPSPQKQSAPLQGSLGGGLSMGGVAAVWGPSMVETPQDEQKVQQRREEEAEAEKQYKADIAAAIEASKNEANDGVDIYGRNLNNGGTVDPAYQSPPKPVELTEKEKMAAALFGGISSTSSSSVATNVGVNRNPRKTTTQASDSAPVPAPVPAQVPAPVSVPVPAAPTPTPAPAAASIDLLDMGFDSPPSTPSKNNINGTAAALDPFGSMSISDPPSQQAQTGKFSSNNQPIIPSNINTASFASSWGAPGGKQFTLSVPKTYALEGLNSKIASFGFAVVETIQATNEMISAGSVGALSLLLHSKIGTGRVDFIIKIVGGGGDGLGKEIVAFMQANL